MDILTHRTFARAGLVGNPSDGYHGKTISVVVRNFYATVVLYEWEDVEFVRAEPDQSRFRSVRDLVRDVKSHGLYGGIPLLKATVKRFVEYCGQQKLALHDRNFSLRYQSTIPRQVGLAGSSAIIIAALRCLMDFYGITIPPEVQPSLALAVEREELGITAGLQDRVVQVYEGVVYMDFARDRMKKLHGYEHGVYERLDPQLLPPLYLAYYDGPEDTDFIQTTHAAHVPIRVRYEQGDREVIEAMNAIAGLAVEAWEALRKGKHAKLASLLDRNFDLRRSIYKHMLRGQIRMVEEARAAGASANFAGSGGAIVGTYVDDAMFQRLQERLEAIGCRVLKPEIAPVE